MGRGLKHLLKDGLSEAAGHVHDGGTVCGQDQEKKNRGSKFATSAAKLQAPVERDDEGAAGRRKWLIRPLSSRQTEEGVFNLGNWYTKTSRGPAGG
jgi:hypothetical protein